ncbi:ParB-like protein [Paraburkholderia sp. BR10937]|uniref:ParB-like protein n=1 Tax=Paraburkholderia sp. BR10937 TaxID=3236994 RepID=UPI0034D345C7
MNLPNTDLHLITVKLDELRPTQITVGFREVNAKRAHWQTLDKKGRAAAIDSHWFPAVLGPKSRYYVVDHHHLGRAWLEESVESVRVTVLKDLSWLEPTLFWRMMEHNQWVHPFDAAGERCEFDHPTRVICRAGRAWCQPRRQRRRRRRSRRPRLTSQPGSRSAEAGGAACVARARCRRARACVRTTRARIACAPVQRASGSGACGGVPCVR